MPAFRPDAPHAGELASMTSGRIPALREVVGGRGSEHPTADDHDLGGGRQLRARVGDERDRLRRRSEDRRGWGHTGGERTIGRCHAPRRFAFARARSRSPPR